MRFIIIFVAIVSISSCKVDGVLISEVRKVGQPITLSYTGPLTSEMADDNPFMNYRLNVIFQKGNEKYDVPGYYAADGHSAETSSNSGNIWKVKFTPPTAGKWVAKASFRYGKQIAITKDLGEGVFFDGATSVINVEELDSSAPGFYAKGKLKKSDNHHLRHSGNGEYFLKAGAGSPENFLAYIDFDGTSRMQVGEKREGEAFTTETLHRYEPHTKDWEEGDPTWQNGKGKSIIGALNYLSSKEMNSVYMLTMNINGDGKDVWPYTHPDEKFRFDCSKLDQWDIVFDHMDQKGLLLHILFQETENELLLDGGDTGPERKIYLREMIARYGHHLGVIWNMGEENGPAHWAPHGQTTEQQMAMLDYVASTDPYDNLRVIHSHSELTPRRELFTKLIDHPTLDGMSMQIDKRQDSYKETKYWIEETAKKNKPWYIAIDEIGHFSIGADPDDKPSNNQDSIIKEVVWGNLMAGGQGVEWYFGYKSHNNDLGCEDWRSRDRLWEKTADVLRFFRALPFGEMTSQNKMINSKTNDVQCLARLGDLYLIYLSNGTPFSIDFDSYEGEYDVKWYNPIQLEEPMYSSKMSVTPLTSVLIDDAPNTDDWVVLIQKN